MKKYNKEEALKVYGQELYFDVAEEYLKDGRTRKTVAEQYNMSPSAVSKLIDEGIAECILSYHTSEMIRDKTLRIQSRHIRGGKVSLNTERHYKDLFKKRIEYVRSLNVKRAQEIVNLYMECYVGVISKITGFSPVEINIILRNCIIYGIVSLDDTKKMMEIAVKRAPKEKKDVEREIERYVRLRDEYASITSQIEMYEYQLKLAEDQEFELSREVFFEERLASLKKQRDDFRRYY